MKVAATSRLPLGLLLLGRAEEHSQAAHRRPGTSAFRSPSRSCLYGDSRGSHCAREFINQEPDRQPLNLFWGPGGLEQQLEELWGAAVLEGEGRDWSVGRVSYQQSLLCLLLQRHTVGV